MSPVAGIPEPVIVVSGVAVIVACGCAGAAAILDLPMRQRVSPRSLALLDRERDVAAALGWRLRSWVAVRLALAAGGVAIGVASGVWLLAVLLGLIALLGFRFLVAGRAAKRRLQMERAFLAQLRVLRDRMAVANQSLDTALQEIGRNPGHHLERVLSPLSRPGSITDNIVECGLRSRSPIVEHACAVLLWARTRSLDALIEAIDDVLMPVSEAQVAVQEESLVTLTQQRAVTFAMAGLMTVMFISIIRVGTFRAYYQTWAGSLVLLVAVAVFFLLIGLLSRIARVAVWTRWDLRKLAELETRPHG
jgi:hypothetical protein